MCLLVRQHVGTSRLLLRYLPSGMDANVVEQRIVAYMRAKSTQVAADRAYGLIFDRHSRLGQLRYLNASANI